MTSALIENSLSSLLQTGVDNHVFPGAVAGILDREGTITLAAVGAYTYEENATPMQLDTVFDVASITKSIPTSCLALKLVEEEKLSLDQKLAELLPSYQGEQKNEITLRDLLTFRVEFGHTLSRLKNLPALELQEAVLHSTVHLVPTPEPQYTNTTSILTGWIIEHATGKILDILAQEYFFTPLHMTKTTFRPDPIFTPPTEEDSTWRKRRVEGTVHDESAAVLQALGIPGSAGLFSTVPDLLKFLQALIAPAPTAPLFTTDSIAQMTRNFFPTGEVPGGLGWELQASWMGDTATPTTAGKTGFTGCCCIWDPQQKVAGVLLSNTQYPHRQKDPQALKKMRQLFGEMILPA